MTKRTMQEVAQGVAVDTLARLPKGMTTWVLRRVSNSFVIALLKQMASRNIYLYHAYAPLMPHAKGQGLPLIFGWRMEKAWKQWTANRMLYPLLQDELDKRHIYINADEIAQA